MSLTPSRSSSCCTIWLAADWLMEFSPAAREKLLRRTTSQNTRRDFRCMASGDAARTIVVMAYRTCAWSEGRRLLEPIRRPALSQKLIKRMHSIVGEHEKLSSREPVVKTQGKQIATSSPELAKSGKFCKLIFLSSLGWAGNFPKITFHDGARLHHQRPQCLPDRQLEPWPRLS